MSRRKKKSRRKGRRINISTTKKQPLKIEDTKKSSLIRLIQKWFCNNLGKVSLGTILTLLTFYLTYYPEKITVENRYLGENKPLSDAVVLTNPNLYDLNNVTIKIECVTDLILSNGNIMGGNKIYSDMVFPFIESKKSKSFQPLGYDIEKDKILDIKNTTITVFISYDTPIFYPNVVKDTFLFTAFLKENKEVIYLPK